MYAIKSVIVGVLLSLSLIGIKVQAETQIAVLNYQAVLFNSAAGQAAAKVLDERIAPQVAQLRAIEQRLGEARRQLETDREILTDEELQGLQQQIQQLFGQASQLRNFLQQQQQESRDAYVKSVQETIRTIVMQLVSERSLDLVLDVQNVIHANAALDVTSEVLAKFDVAYAEANQAASAQ